MKILIIEDEAAAARRLQRQVANLQPQAEIIGVLASLREVRSWLQEGGTADLILMDIHLSDGSSFELLTDFEEKIPIIFTTAYDEYALKAFKAHSVDYLLKPIKEEALKAAFDKLQELQKGKGKQEITLPIEELQALLQPTKPAYKQRFLIRLPEKLKTVEVADIAYFFIESRITFMRLKSGSSFPVEYTLEQLDQVLEPGKYFRVNRQLSVSFASIQEMHLHTKSRFKLKLAPEYEREAIVSSERAAAFKAWLQTCE
ncbi:MAG: LytTR family DNA-binding domain-containing protein [Bacteroidota bacterium]